MSVLHFFVVFLLFRSVVMDGTNVVCFNLNLPSQRSHSSCKISSNEILQQCNSLTSVALTFLIRSSQKTLLWLHCEHKWLLWLLLRFPKSI